jgi:hypothetical protein
MENRPNEDERANLPKPLRRTVPHRFRRSPVAPPLENFAEPADDDRVFVSLERLGQET